MMSDNTARDHGPALTVSDRVSIQKKGHIHFTKLGGEVITIHLGFQ